VTPSEGVRERITRIEILLGDAIGNWEAGNLSQGQASATLLNLALTDLEAVRAIVAEHPVSKPSEMRLQVGAIRSETLRFIRVLDASTAFCRGMAARIGGGEGANIEQPGNHYSVDTQG
jgi:hypothetical protein